MDYFDEVLTRRFYYELKLYLISVSGVCVSLWAILARTSAQYVCKLQHSLPSHTHTARFCGKLPLATAPEVPACKGHSNS